MSIAETPDASKEELLTLLSSIEQAIQGAGDRSPVIEDAARAASVIPGPSSWPSVPPEPFAPAPRQEPVRTRTKADAPAIRPTLRRHPEAPPPRMHPARVVGTTAQLLAAFKWTERS